MKPISVREAAQALGLTKRAIVYRIETGKLNAMRTKNSSGVEEYRIYPNKELIEALNRAGAKDPLTEDTAGEVEDVYDGDIQDLETVQSQQIETETTASVVDPERHRVRLLAEEFMRPLVEKLAQQALAITDRDQIIEESDKIIEEQKRQLRLLPDLQQRAEQERKAAEVKEFEAVALRKQIEEIDEKRSEELRQKELELQAAKELAATMEQERLKSEVLLQEEITRLREEKDLQASAVQTQLASLTQKLERLDKPWWKKMFSAPEN